MRWIPLLVVTSLAAWALSSEAASAKPVYLSCVTVENGDSEKFNITADEDTGMVSVSDQTGSQSMRAAFSSDQVTFSDHVAFDYSINRIDLTIIVRRWNGSVAKGKCQIAPARRRAF